MFKTRFLTKNIGFDAILALRDALAIWLNPLKAGLNFGWIAFLEAVDLPMVLLILSAASFQLLRMAHVGSYAIQPVWADGHATGISPFDYLKQIAAANPYT